MACRCPKTNGIRLQMNGFCQVAIGMIAYMPGDSTDCPWPSESDRPQRAPVPPRVCAGGKAALLLEDVIKPYLGRAGVVQIVGPSGSGKSVALDHLLAISPPNSFVAIDNVTESHTIPLDRLAVVTGSRPRGSNLATFEMSGWTFDDCVQYLSRVHREQCKSVIDRLLMDETTPLLESSPRLLRISLDEMAADASVGTCSMALRKHLAERIPLHQRFGIAALWLPAVLWKKTEFDPRDLDALNDPHVADLLRHHIVGILLSAERVAEKLRESQPPEELATLMPLELVKEIAHSARKIPTAIERLNDLINGKDRRFDAMAASILLAADPEWRPKSGRNLQLMEGYFEGAKWNDCDLQGANLTGADFSHADLSHANLTKVQALGATFMSAKLEGAKLNHGSFRSDFTLANLMHCQAREATFDFATFEAANLQFGDFTLSSFQSSCLKLASFAKATLDMAQLISTTVEDADFGEAQFVQAALEYVRLREATCIGANFQSALVRRCNLEGMDLSGANFGSANLDGSDLTGSHIVQGKFTNAKLTNTGLADVDWPGADLRNVDFTGASFHMGSSRSGLVGSTIPSEGSRTGFYTDDYNDQDFKDPEEIRKANLCNADLRGADVRKTDFYLVDLRGAKLSPDDVVHFMRTGAILRSRVT